MFSVSRQLTNRTGRRIQHANKPGHFHYYSGDWRLLPRPSRHPRLQRLSAHCSPRRAVVGLSIEDGGHGYPSIRVMFQFRLQAHVDRVHALGTALLFRRAMYQQEGVARANDANSIGRLVGWVAAAPRHGWRYGLGRTGKRDRRTRARLDENALDSAPAMRATAKPRVVAQK